MHTVSGQIIKFLQDSHGNLEGLVLDGGQLVRFPANQGHLVSLIVCVGSHVGIECILHSGNSAEEFWEATLITNFDSKRSVTFLAPKCQARPGVLLRNTPTSAASLVHPAPPVSGQISEKRAVEQTSPEAHNPFVERMVSRSEAQPSVPHEHSSSHVPQSPSVARRDATASIGQAYDRLHRIQAILAYLHIMKRKVPGIGQFLDEAKHTYEQSLARYEARNFVAASEFAAASVSLSRVVEIIISRTLRSDSTLPSLVPPPPDHFSSSSDSGHIEGELAEAESVLSRIRWLLENGTLPLEDRTQVRRIASWGDALYKQAQHLYRQAALPDAAELAQAALAGAHSAEHVCRKWYVGQASHPPDQVSDFLCPH